VIKENLRNAREQKGMTQEELEQLSGISQSMISALENGKIPNPTIGTVRALSQALDIDINELVKETNND
jgi:transcriptional regulator with XRE-family HTH domain